MSTRKQVEIPDKAWLDTLKFLMGPQWRKMRFVSHRIAEVVKGNISEMPRIIIDNVSFWKANMHLKPIKMVASGIVIPPNEKKEWFMKRGINLDAPEDLQHQDAIVEMDAKYGDQNKPSIFYFADGNEPAGASKTTWSKQKMTKRPEYQGIRKLENSIFSAGFNPDLNEYSWASMEYFLNLLYNPLTYIKKLDMYALNKNVTDAFFLGEDYGNHIHCGKFTLIGDLCKSLPWIQRNVRADLIYLPGEFIDVEKSFKETSNCLLDMPWMCANQTGNVIIKFECIHYWKSFIKILIKKFRTLTTIQHATPLIEFHCKNLDRNPDLTFLVWDPEVVKLKPKDSQGAETAYMISNGRNRMEIALFKKRDLVTVKTYTIDSATPSREKVHFLNDTWLETLKFLKFSNWSKALFVSRQLAGVVQCNISCLPRIIVYNATIYEMTSLCSSLIIFDETIPENEENHFFTELGISLNAPDDVHYENAFIGESSKNWAFKCNSIAIILRGISQVQTIFSGQLNKEQEHLWAALKYFLEFIYYPAVYTKEVEMLALNQKLIDDCFDGAERFIRCGLFTWKGRRITMTADDLGESLSWLEKNIRAETIQFPRNVELMGEHFYDRISIFLLDSSWKCARKEIKFEWIDDLNGFLEALVKKFRSVSFVRDNTPTFTTTAYGDDETMSLLLLDPDVKKLKSDDFNQCADVYLISHGDNRMQIEIVKRRKYDPDEDDDYNYDDDYEYFGDSDDDYGYHDYYGEEDVEHDDDFRKEEKECIINVKVYRV